MELILAISILTCLAVLVALFFVVRGVAARGSDLPLTPEWIDELSVERYRPMMRLLDGEDIEFLRTQPGFTPRMAARLRLQRCQIFQGYLRCLTADFGRVCAAVKLLVVQSNLDRPDLPSVLLHQQAMFACGVAAVQFRLFLYRWGLCNVDVTSLVKTFDRMRLELKVLVPAAVPAGA